MLDVAVLDPFLAKPEYAVCLRGYIGRGEGGYRQVWWESNEVEQAASSLLAYAVSWLEDRGDIARLIALFESGIAARQSVEEMDRGQDRNEITDSILKNMFPSGLSPAFPFEYHRWLSLLYFHRGPDTKADACIHAREYGKYVHHIEGLEPERTLRQLAEMGCDAVGSNG